MSNTTRMAIVLAFWLAPVSSLTAAFGQSSGVCSGDEDTMYYYGNGVFNLSGQAGNSAFELQGFLNEKLPPDAAPMRVIVSYNHSEGFSKGNQEGFISQFRELLRQKGVDSMSSFWRWIQGIGDPPDWFIESVEGEIKRIASREYVIDEDLNTHVNKYQSDIREGKRVVLTAHSQGNFYANQAYPLVDSEAFGIVAVATPASSVAGGFPWATLTDDLVIGVLEAIDPTTLDANVTNSFFEGAWYGHAFDSDYLAESSASAERLASYYRSLNNTLPEPEQEVGDGVITVTLEWGDEPDVDLHVFEPGGTHVYYSNQNGESGFLDVDDVTGFGPEHYYAECSGLQEGTYGIGVNFYSGTPPETAEVQIEAGSKVRNYSVTLQNERGSAGNSDPVPVAEIVVSEEEDGGYAFEVDSGSRSGASSLAAGAYTDETAVKAPKSKSGDRN